MSDLAQTLRTVALGIALLRSADRFRAAVRAAAARAMIGVAMFVTAMVAAGFFVAAGYMYARTLMDPIYAALLIGGLLLVKVGVWAMLARSMAPAR